MDLKVPTDKSKYEKTSRSFTHSYKVKRSLKLSTKPKHETKTWKHGTTISTQSPIKEILSESLVNETSIPAIGKNAPIPRQNSTADISQTDLKIGYKSLDQYSTPTADYNSWNVKKFDPSNIKSTSRKILSSETESKLERVSEKDNFIQPDIDILNDFTEIPKPSKLVFLDKKNDQKKFTRNFKYDPALIMMGLGKRSKQSITTSGLNRLSNDESILKQIGLGNVNYDHKSMLLGKRSSTYDPALKYMGLGKRNNIYDPALQFTGLDKREDSNTMPLKKVELEKRQKVYDPALNYMGLGKKKSYDPALKYMGLGKRLSSYDPALKFMGLGKRKSSYNPALKYMDLGKRESAYDPALRYMGLGKKSDYDPALKYMGLGKKSDYDPALGYMGLGKKFDYDPALRYMGLGKKSSYDPALKYMGLGKKSDYDPALRYMGLGKKSDYDPALRYMGLGKKSSYDPALKYMGLGKKSDYDPALRYMGLGKKSDYDPALRYMGLGKKSSYDPALKYMGLGKKSDYDPALRYMGLGKKSDYDPALRYMGLGKKSSYDPALKFMGLGKRQYKYDPAMKYLDLGKRVSSETKANGLIQKTIQDNPTGNEYITKTKSQKNKNTPQHENYSPNKEAHSNDDPAFKNLGLDKKDFSYDRTLDFMSKRQSKVKDFDSDDKDELSNLVSVNDNYNDELYQSFVFTPFIGTSQKKNPKFDPALNFMGLGKRINTSNQPSKITSLDEKFLKHELVKSFLNPIQDDYKIVNHKFQPFLKSLMNSSLKIDCIKCNPTDRHKRSLAGFEQFNNMDLDKTEAKNGFANVKRDYYNRPKYNPGWIFIGLGKRSSLLQEPLINYDAYETESTRAGKKIAPQIVFDKYYDLLCTIQKSIEEIQNDLKNKNKLSVSEKNLEKPDTISELGVNWYRIPYGNYAYINDDPNESHLRKPEEKDVVWSQIQPPFGTDTHVINT
nr:uncharacterized protein LOC122268952 [Parasteatoda tepidariorum]